jgi:hypothetical protein
VAYYVIASTDGAALAAYRDSLSFRTDFLYGKPAEVSQGLHLQAELDDQGGVGPVHWLLVEEDTRQGSCGFGQLVWSSDASAARSGTPRPYRELRATPGRRMLQPFADRDAHRRCDARGGGRRAARCQRPV